jgi:hypothetical protein
MLIITAATKTDFDNFTSFPSPDEPDPRFKVICLQGLSTCSTREYYETTREQKEHK